jgi:hypothetical protein
MQETISNLKVDANGNFTVGVTARGYGVSLRVAETALGGYPVVVCPDGDVTRARVVRGPGYVGWYEGWATLKVAAGVPSAGDIWEATVFTTLDDRQGGAEGNCVDRLGRLQVVKPPTELFSYTKEDLWAVSGKAKLYLRPDGTISEVAGAPWDLRGYARLLLTFGQTEAPRTGFPPGVPLSGPLWAKITGVPAADWAVAQEPAGVIGQTRFDLGDAAWNFGNAGRLGGLLEIGAAATYTATPGVWRYAASVPPFAWFTWESTGEGFSWGGQARLTWHAYAR